jgi:hypothetical protein
MATKRKRVKNNLAVSSLIKGRKSFNLAPIAIPLFSTKSNLKKPTSTIGRTP